MQHEVRDSLRQRAWWRSYLEDNRALLLTALALGVVVYGFAVALMFTSGYMISLAATLPLTVLALHLPSIFVRIFGVGKPLIQYVQRLLSHDWVLRMTSALRVRIFESLEARFHYLSQHERLGEVLGAFADDIEHIQDLFLRTVLPLAISLCIYGLVVILCGVFSWQLGLMLLITLGVATIILPLLALGFNRVRIRRMEEERMRMQRELTDDLLCLRDWRLTGREEDFLTRCATIYEERFQSERRANLSVRRFETGCHILFLISLSAVLIWSASVFAQGSAEGPSWIALSESVSALGAVTAQDSVPYAANWIAAFVIGFFPLIEIFSPNVRAILGSMTQSIAFANVGRIVEDDGRKGIVDSPAGGSTHLAAHTPGLSEERSEAAVIMEDVSFAYAPGDHAVLDHLDLTIPKGQHVALLGRSGAGKSTLSRLLSGDLSPIAGTLAVEGRVGIVEQAPYIFRQSVRENLLLAKPDATDEELLEALQRVALLPWFSRLPDGLDTEMADGGITLSGGERHRLALARILLFQADIIMLDEPYLGLDPETEHELSAMLFDVFKDETMVCITHHLKDIDAFDRVVYLEGGSLVMDGDPASLERGDERFRELRGFEHGRD